MLVFDQQMLLPVVDIPSALRLDIEKAALFGQLEVGGVCGLTFRPCVGDLVLSYSTDKPASSICRDTRFSKPDLKPPSKERCRRLEIVAALRCLFSLVVIVGWVVVGSYEAAIDGAKLTEPPP